MPAKLLQLNIPVRGGTVGGDVIMSAARDLGLEAGEMQIFHRYDDSAPGDQVVYSMANLVEPGSFPLQDMSAFTSPGVTLFAQLPGPRDGLRVFEEMLAAAQRLAALLGGEIQDETHSDLSRQTIEHIRAAITEHSRLVQLARRRR